MHSMRVYIFYQHINRRRPCRQSGKSDKKPAQKFGLLSSTSLSSYWYVVLHMLSTALLGQVKQHVTEPSKHQNTTDYTQVVTCSNMLTILIQLSLQAHVSTTIGCHSDDKQSDWLWDSGRERGRPLYLSIHAQSASWHHCLETQH